ncbi:ribonuclease R [Xylanibacter ruminicola]|jgi:ribonuclease R|uniref:Ribonuclease R n=2 Tax=Xylanibacter ruminicola TaxID=839 RepID=D5EY37_XYLR2|nr:MULTISPECIES: ribonuclease R [Prevotellaceae]MBO4896531.1 ribonuclease R [Prevotella sp.]ADE82594.1 ribonuclease R [Xylanibacter ruminicola 23]QVJ82130.1 ribonuclease R [Xylanibacter ruminicola]SDQ32732.1 ribonuclease R [Prevotella sp. khp1]SEH83111.1 ribonuclease R [Xylanibacter ruminicola]
MGKKKGGKRLGKKQVSELLQNLFQHNPNETFSFKQIFKVLKLDTHPLKMLAIDVMEEMAWDDFLLKVSDNSYKLNLKTQVQEGIFHRKANGRNSFVPDDGGTPVFVAERNSMSAMDGDHVKVSLMARRDKHIKEAMVIEIVKRAHDTIVGKLRVEKDIAFLVTADSTIVHDIIIPKRKLKGGKTDDKAVVKIIQWPDQDHKNIIGQVIDILGKTGENNAEMHAILAQYNLPYKYPKNVEEAAEKIDAAITPEEIARREDFRDVFTCTIDPKDAKDFDDALSIRKTDKGLWEVGVHIADVSHYVKEGSTIDKEAYARATSIYLVDRTIPMLPERLCNFICSLRPDEEKLCYSVIFKMDDEANIKDWHLAHTVIKSDRRYAYEEVQQIIEEGKGENAEFLLKLDALAKKLREARFKNGSVKFDREELHFDIDETGKPIRAYFKVSKDANKLIEEFMLLANKTVAESIGRVKKGVKAKTLPYRIHDQPDPQKLENLREFVAKFGYKVKTAGTKGAITKSLNALMSQAEGTREQNAIETVALRAMMKAKYSVHNIGHYGLAFDYYTHFTSPIRRYPDMMVHRLLTKYQDGARSANKDKYEEFCEHCSDMEQISMNAERDSIKYKMVEFMADKIGNTYDAHISGIQSYGIYAQIDETHCEGMIPIRDLGNDYYDFDEKNYMIVGRRHHTKYQLGDPIRIQVARANLERKQLDFTLADD